MTNLDFTRDAQTGSYYASFTSEGDPVAVHLNRKTNGYIRFYASVGTLRPVMFASFNNADTPANFFRVLPLIPNGVNVTIESGSEVESGGYEG